MVYETFSHHDVIEEKDLWVVEKKEKYIDEPENWSHAESVLRDVLKRLGLKFVEVKERS